MSAPAAPAATSASRAPGPGTIGLLCLLVTSLGWGLNWPAMKVLLREWPPLFARGTAGLAAAAIIAALALLRGQPLAVPRGVAGRLTGSALCNVFAWMGFATLAMRWLSVGQAALLVYTMPIWATLLAWPVSGQRPSRSSVLGLLLCLSGLWTLFGSRQIELEPVQWLGVGLSLLSAALFAYATVALRPITEMPPLAVLAWQLTIGCAPMVALGLAFEHPRVAGLSSVGWRLMGYMTVVPMGLCYLTWFAALRRLAPATASVATLLTPVIGVFAAALALGEPLGAREIAALVLTLGGVAVTLSQPLARRDAASG
jgi:drug/metabolite transporter (DMT)-like permease